MGMGFIKYLCSWIWTAFNHSLGIADTSGVGIIIILGFLSWLSGKLPQNAEYPAPVEVAMQLTEWQIIAGVLGAIIVIRLLFSPYWMQKELLNQRNKLKEDLQNAKWNNEQTWRREDISGQKYPNKIPSILHDMRICLMDLMDKASSNEVTIKQLWLPLSLTPEEFAEALRQKSYDENTEVLYKWHGRMNKSGIGLMELNDAKWNKLDSELEYLKKDIPDQELKDHIRQHIYALKGYHARMLYHNYCIKTGTKDAGDLPQILKSFFVIDGLLDFTLARVTNRLQKLRSGAEPK